MKKLIALLLCALMVVSASVVTLADTDEGKLATLAEEVIALTPEERAEFVAGMFLWMAFNGEDELLQNALDGAFSTGESNDTAPRQEDVKDESNGVEMGTKDAPVPLGDSIDIDFEMNDVNASMRISVLETWTGAEAFEMADDTFILYPGPATDEEEYLVIKISEELLNASEQAPVHVHSAYFKLLANDGVVYADYGHNIDGLDKFPEMYEGGKAEGYIAFKVKKGDTPLLMVLKGYTTDREPVFFSTFRKQ